jgi:ATP-binding cassette subfamily B protein
MTKPATPEKEASRYPLFKWFFRRYFVPHLKVLMFIMGLILVQGYVYQQFLSVMENGLRVIFEAGSRAQLLQICALIVGIFAIRATASYLIPRLSAIVAADAVLHIRRDLINVIVRLDQKFFDNTPPSEMILRLFSQPDGLSRFVGQSTVNAVRDMVTILFIGGWLFAKQPLLMFMSLASIPLILFALNRTTASVRAAQRAAENAFGAYINNIEEMVNGMRAVKISNQQELERQRLSSAASNMSDLMKDLMIRQAFIQPVLDISTALACIIIIGFGGSIVLNGGGSLDAAELITFLLGLVLIFEPARQVSTYYVQLQASSILIESLHAMFFTEPSMKTPANPKPFSTDGDLVLEDVEFSYNDDTPVLHGVSLKLAAGKTTAIVGPTGSGKTSVFNLITRLYDIQGGKVMFDGVDLRDVDLHDLRSSFAVVTQDIVIFNRSIEENVRYVRPDASEEEVAAAVEAAQLTDVIAERGTLPVGPKGAQLSGGQKQRIAIARALLVEAPVILLDEATSALDQKTEDRILQSLNKAKSGKTIIMVTHKLSSAVGADRIYVMESGQVVESGTHKDLMSSDGLYSQLYSSQKSNFAEQ